ncbi:MAG: aldo/keto reductase, partial [Fimbriimonadaceae bacterium]|nr:aldo/keto reductase [Fimbriimonadaceae bacterium]
MEYRRLGRSGLKVSVIALGNWLTQNLDGSQEQTDALVKTAFEAGINLFDTADVYAQGEGEIVLGRSLKTLG